MILAFILAAWLWDRVLTSCAGGPETVVSYHFQATMRQNILEPCLDDQGLPALCLSTVPAAPLRFGPDIPDPGEGDTVSTTADPVDIPEMLPTPPVGGLAAWPWLTLDNPAPVVAVDAAGNQSWEVCP